jgi:hypothetical protein
MDEETDMARGSAGWTRQEARLLRRRFLHLVAGAGPARARGTLERGRPGEVAEEIESLGREQFHKLESALRVLMMRMLKWDHQPERRSRSWAVTIDTQRIELEHVLAENPGLKPRIGDAMTLAYRKA